MDVHVPLLESASTSNDEHLRRAVQVTLDLPQSKIGFFGLAFKENTDDLRESPVLHLLEQVIGKGRNVRVWDPHIQIDHITGKTRPMCCEPFRISVSCATARWTIFWAGPKSWCWCKSLRRSY